MRHGWVILIAQLCEPKSLDYRVVWGSIEDVHLKISGYKKKFEEAGFQSDEYLVKIENTYIDYEISDFCILECKVKQDCSELELIEKLAPIMDVLTATPKPDYHGIFILEVQVESDFEEKFIKLNQHEFLEYIKKI